MEKQTQTVTVTLSYQNQEIAAEDKAPLTITSKEPYRCKYCTEKITLEQVKKVVSTIDTSVATKVLECLNTYKVEERFKLDTCLRKAHFINQVASETEFRNMKESHDYHYNNLKISKFSKSQVLDSIMITSLEDHLTDIFKITNDNNTEISKTVAELKVILTAQTPEVDVRKLYGRYKGGDEIVKTVMKKGKDEKEVIDYNIVLKNHGAFRIPLFSRLYANHNDSNNGDELSRDGYKFCGKGIKQITHRDNYTRFTKRRKAMEFPDYDKHIDFTANTNDSIPEGNYDKLADKNDVVYGVQAAIWYWLEGSAGTDAYAYADADDIVGVSYAINGGWNGFENGDYPRKAGILKARKAFKVYDHYKLFYENGTQSDKDKVKENLNRIGKGYSKKGQHVAKDVHAEKVLTHLDPAEELDSMPEKAIEFKVEVSRDLKLLPISSGATDRRTKGKKNNKKRKQ